MSDIEMRKKFSVELLSLLLHYRDKFGFGFGSEISYSDIKKSLGFADQICANLIGNYLHPAKLGQLFVHRDNVQTLAETIFRGEMNDLIMDAVGVGMIDKLRFLADVLENFLNDYNKLDNKFIKFCKENNIDI